MGLFKRKNRKKDVEKVENIVTEADKELYNENVCKPIVNSEEMFGELIKDLNEIEQDVEEVDDFAAVLNSMTKLEEAQLEKYFNGEYSRPSYKPPFVKKLIELGVFEDFKDERTQI